MIAIAYNKEDTYWQQRNLAQIAVATGIVKNGTGYKIPLYYPTGEFSGFYQRHNPAGKPRYCHEEGKPTDLRWFWTPQTHLTKQVIITESTSDTLAILAAGSSSVLGLFGTSFTQKHVFDLVRWQVEKIVVYPHIDKAGIRLAQTILEKLTDSGISLEIRKLPTKDLAETWQQASDCRAFWNTLANCPPLKPPTASTAETSSFNGSRTELLAHFHDLHWCPYHGGQKAECRCLFPERHNHHDQKKSAVVFINADNSLVYHCSGCLTTLKESELRQHFGLTTKPSKATNSSNSTKLLLPNDAQTTPSSIASTNITNPSNSINWRSWLIMHGYDDIARSLDLLNTAGVLGQSNLPISEITERINFLSPELKLSENYVWRMLKKLEEYFAKMTHPFPFLKTFLCVSKLQKIHGRRPSNGYTLKTLADMCEVLGTMPSEPIAIAALVSKSDYIAYHHGKLIADRGGMTKPTIAYGERLARSRATVYRADKRANITRTPRTRDVPVEREYRKTEEDEARGAKFARTAEGKLMETPDGQLILKYPLPSLRTAENFRYAQTPTVPTQATLTKTNPAIAKPVKCPPLPITGEQKRLADDTPMAGLVFCQNCGQAAFEPSKKCANPDCRSENPNWQSQPPTHTIYMILTGDNTTVQSYPSEQNIPGNPPVMLPRNSG